MINLFKQELGEIHSFFKNNYKEAVVLCTSTLFIVLAICRPIGSSLVASYLIYYAILPIFTIFIILRRNPLDFGLRLGDYKLWSFYVAITVVIAIPVLYIGSLFSSVGQYYTKPFDYYSFFTQMVPLLFFWEYILRGFLLFGLKERFKEAKYTHTDGSFCTSSCRKTGNRDTDVYSHGIVVRIYCLSGKVFLASIHYPYFY